MAGQWLVKLTGPGTGNTAAPPTAEIQSFPDGVQPPQAKWGGAVYLGPTAAAANRWVAKAAQMLHVPNPQRVPSLGTSFGIISAELAGGFAALGGIGDAGAAGAADTAAVSAEASAGSSAASGAAGSAGGSAGAKLAEKGLAGALGVAGIEAFGVRALEGLAGAALILLGLQALTGGDGNPVRQVKRAGELAGRAVL